MMDTALIERLDGAARVGMTAAMWADVQPNARAVRDPDGTWHSFATANARANRLARLLRGRGLAAGDAVALVCSNRVEFVDALFATRRAGLRLTPINWHLTADEVAYIIADCEAKAVLAEPRVAGLAPLIAANARITVRLGIGGALDGFEPYDAALASYDDRDIADPLLGTTMLYTSGTTGRPKGVHRPNAPIIPQAALALRGYHQPGVVQLCAGPAYHAAPLVFDVGAATASGAPLIFLDKWDSETVLRTISEEKVTHLHLVPIMFQRLLALPDAVKSRYPVDHVRHVIHGAAPCPPEVKRAMIDWFGPVLHEYYAGSEGGSGFMISSAEWLAKPGSVGKRPALLQVRILDEEGRPLPNGQEGGIYHQIPPGADFSYHGDADKTAGARVDGFFTMGDIGYFDADDYLFLTGRSAETIISGGVNIYPQEVDNVLLRHPAVADCATIGAPHPDWGEEVRVVVMLGPGYTASDTLSTELLTFARAALPGFKSPRALDFAVDLPRSEAGKIQRGKVRAPYWAGRERQI